MKIAALLLVSTSLFAQKNAMDKATLEAYLRNVELWQPQVSVKIDDPKKSNDVPGFAEVWIHLSFNNQTLDQMYYVSLDGRSIVKGVAYDINKNPFQSNLDKLKTDGAPSFGPANAPVTLVVFSDFQCPLCKQEAQELRKNLTTVFPDKVRLYFKDFPLDALHNWARTAAIAGRCVYKLNPAAFWDYHDWAYDNQTYIGLDNINSKLQEFATQKHLDGMQLARCIESKATEAEVNSSVAQGRELMVSATPTIYLNGRKLEGAVPWESMQQLINVELDHLAKAKAAAKDEKCCEVTIPKIVK